MATLAMFHRLQEQIIFSQVRARLLDPLLALERECILALRTLPNPNPTLVLGRID